MLDLVSQRAFRECAQHHVSMPGIPGNVEGAGFSIPLGRNAGLSERSELAPETESVPTSLEPRGLVGPRNDASRPIVGVAVNLQLIDAPALIRNHTFGTGTEKGDRMIRLITDLVR
jgi:hypothetical protein